MAAEETSQDILSIPVREFLAATAAKQPTPGGGSVAGVVAGLGVALGEMALNFTKGKKKYAEHEALYDRLSPRLEKARQMCQDLVADDIVAYKLYQQSMRQADGPEKDEAIQLAIAAAIDVPRQMTKLALAVQQDLLELAPKCNPWLISDLVAAAVLAFAAVKVSDFNVRINVPQVAEKEAAKQLREASHADVKKSAKLMEAIEKAASEYL